MSSAVAPCPPADALAAFAFGEIDRELAGELQSHITQCADCLEIVGHLACSRTAAAATPGTQSSTADPILCEPGQMIGPFRLVCKLGDGGMGEVWEAEQLAPVRRTVALKLLKPGMDTRQIVARFEAERQVLALMQHPGIAQMFDAGIAGGGRSYFVMEYVNGIRITEYCDRAKLDIGRRLLLFQQVCDALQHAHQKGAIHRDIKPSNVLVTEQDGRPLPKVIDFGIAKLTSSPLAELTLTEVGTLLGTPAYASPEQMSLGVIDIDTRSDVYSLGVLLYELLVGALPFEATAASPAALLELRRSIRESEPIRPSTRVSRLGSGATDLADKRGAAPTILRRQLRGDLDWIVMKALEKDRTRRYNSPAELARDTQRYLDHEPVWAGSPTPLYRMAKFVRRHRLGTAVGVTILGLIVAFVILSAIQVQRANTERDRAAAAARKASSINEFLQDTLGSADPWKSGADVSVRSTLANAVVKAQTSFKDQPDVAAAVQRTIGRTYTSLGLLDDAGPLLSRALETRRALFGPENADVAESLGDLGALEHQRGDDVASVNQFRKALAMQRKLFGSDNAKVADTLLDLAISLRTKGDLQEAYAAERESLAIRERLFGARSVEVALVLSQLAGVELDQGNYEAGESHARRGYEMMKALVGSDDVRTAVAAGNVGEALRARKLFNDSERYARYAYAIQKKQLGEHHPETLTAEENLGNVLYRQNKYDETIRILQDIIQQRRAALGPDNKRVVRSLINLATVMKRAGRLDEAQQTYEEALPRFSKAYGPNHPDTAQATALYGSFLLKNRHDYAAAEQQLRQALSIQVSQLSDDHPNTADTRLWLGEALTERGQLGEAKTLLLRAQQVYEKTYPPDSKDRAEVNSALDELTKRKVNVRSH
jgi:serine/threonine protein kinase/tetratricopeptide (TPR) repeat protein